MLTRVKTSQEIAAIRESGRMLATVLSQLSGEVVEGITTKYLAELAKQELRRLGGQPTFLGYQGFPDVICISINDEVVHGIPRPDRVIKPGDIVSLDFGVTYRGMITDGAITLTVGKVPEKTEKLLRNTKQALLAGIDVVQDGAQVGDISAAIENILQKNQYGIIRDLVGHGVGHELHEEPNIPNYGKKGTGLKLLAGMTIAIEPMASLGSYMVKLDPDNWTIRTIDESLSAHFEHTVLVTEQGPEILTSL